jgi:hypothetical protein
VNPPYAKNAVYAKMPALGALFAESSQSGDSIYITEDMGLNTGFIKHPGKILNFYPSWFKRHDKT